MPKSVFVLGVCVFENVSMSPRVCACVWRGAVTWGRAIFGIRIREERENRGRESVMD